MYFTYKYVHGQLEGEKKKEQYLFQCVYRYVHIVLSSDNEFSKVPYRQSLSTREIQKVLVHRDNQCSAGASPV